MPTTTDSDPDSKRIRRGRSADRRIWAIAGPSIIANSAAPLVGLVDTWAVGQLGDPRHLAAIGVGATIFTFVFWSFGFLRMGTTGMVAQSLGRGDATGMAAHVLRGLATAMVIGLVMLLLAAPLLALGLAALDPPADVLGPLKAYFAIRIWSAPAVLAGYVILGALLGAERARAALLVQLVLNITNGALNVLFVVGLDMGVAGIALGTVLAEALALLIGLWLLLGAADHGSSGRFAAYRAAFDRGLWQASEWLRLFRVNAALFVRTLALISGFALVTEAAADISTVALAASQVLNTYLLLISLGLDGFAYAAETLVGQAAGRRDRAAFTFWAWRTGGWALLTALAYSLVFWVFGPAITAVLTPDPAVRQAIGATMPVLVLMPLLGVASYHFDGIYIGAGATTAMMVTMIISASLYAAALNPLAERFGVPGIWAAVALFLLLRGITQALWMGRVTRMTLRAEQGSDQP